MTALVHLVILGPMGVGKTTVGTMVAERLGWTLVDSDRLLEALHGRTGRDIAATDGVAVLHEMEAEILEEALDMAPPSVIAPAASIADRPQLLRRLTSPEIRVVLLECDPTVLAARADRSDHRRSIDEDTARDFVITRMRNVAPVADLIVNVTATDAASAAAEIYETLNSH